MLNDHVENAYENDTVFGNVHYDVIDPKIEKLYEDKIRLLEEKNPSGASLRLVTKPLSCRKFSEA